MIYITQERRSLNLYHIIFLVINFCKHPLFIGWWWQIHYLYTGILKLKLDLDFDYCNLGSNLCNVLY